MERTDYIEKREDIISNIETLYSYLHGESGEDYKQWAVDKLKRGKNMVIEVIDGHICFAPSRFVGYLNNTKDKHDENHGDGTDTDKRINLYYQKVADERLDVLMQAELSKYEEASANKKYWIPNGMTIEDILAHSDINSRRYWVFAPGESCDHWEECKSKGLMLVGWDEVGDLTQYDDKNSIDAALKKAYPNGKDSYRKNDVSTLWYMCCEIQVGDVVYARNGLSEILGRGVVTSDYFYDEKRDDFCNVRKIKWTHLGRWPASALSIPTIIPKYGQWVEEMEKTITLSESDKTMLNDISKYENQKLDTDVVRQLSGYSRDLKILRYLGYEDVSEEAPLPNVPCVIIYPEEGGEINNPFLNISLKKLCSKSVGGLALFYKIAISVPTLNG